MTFPYKLIDLTHTLDNTIPTWNGGCGFNHDVHIDYSDCEGEYKFRVMKVKMHAGIGTHMDAPSHCIPGGRFIHDFEAIGFSLMSLGTGLVIMSSDMEQFKSNIATKIIAFLGSISYELYLFHIIILGLMRNIIVPQTHSGLSSACLLIVFLLCSVLVGYFIAKFYSERINKMCRRYLSQENPFILVMDTKL